MPNARTTNAVRLDFASDSLVQSNLSGAAFTDDWLWVVGSHGLKRKNAKRLAKVAQDGRRALRLKGDAQTNLLTSALVDDPHFGPYMTIPGKDNGFDIEGLAVDGRRLLLGLRGPVLRGWSALLEIAIETRDDQLRLPHAPCWPPTASQCALNRR